MKHTRNDNAAAREKKLPISPARARREMWKHEVVTQYLRGHSLQQVAQTVKQTTGHGFSTVTLSKYINEAMAEWRQNRTQLMEVHKDVELEKINRLEAEYWAAWDRSCESVKSKSRVKTKGAKADEDTRLAVSMVRDDEKPGNGNPRYLEGIQWCITERCKILGIDAPGPLLAVQVNNNTQNNTVQDNSTTIIRRVVFKTRETTMQPQTVMNE